MTRLIPLLLSLSLLAGCSVSTEPDACPTGKLIQGAAYDYASPTPSGGCTALSVSGDALTWCCAPPPKRSENCGDWDDMRRGLVSCEVGDECAYEAGGKQWVCGCGTDVHIFWCKS
jgi:hypothetical protein